MSRSLLGRATRAGAERFARLAARVDDRRIERLMAGPARRGVLALVFWQMPRQLDRDQAAGMREIVEWRIGGAAEPAVYRLEIEDGRARVRRGAGAEPATVTLTLDAADFLRLVTGRASGPDLFMRGRLRGEGDMFKAMRLNSLFRVPSAG